ncbi:RagB/SusD family nutrient uptake outer membrane protein [Mucilaginibacter puniceus]
MGCKKDLTAIPNSLLSAEIIYTDRALVISTLQQFYNQTNFGQHNGINNVSTDIGTQYDNVNDEALAMDGGASTGGTISFSRDKNKTSDYALLRRMNQFLAGIRSPEAIKALTAQERYNFEAQCLFLRAWLWFWQTKTVGGLTIIGDEIYSYEAGQDLTPNRLPRNTEAECYDYVIAQCDLAIAKFASATAAGGASFGNNATTNAGIANRWAALMLKARAAITAASLAKYNNLITPTYTTPLGEVGIPASKAAGYYEIAYAAAKEVINGKPANSSGPAIASPYVLQVNAANPELAFYNATSVKTGNTEVIWALDRKAPDVVTQFTTNTMPYSHRDQQTGNRLGVLLNLVEAFENRTGTNPNAPIPTKVGSNYVFYDDVEAPFKAKDARLWGTVIWPNALYRGTPVPLQAGQVVKTGSAYTLLSSNTPGATNANGLITSLNGPISSSASNLNKTGFLPRKFVDESAGAGLQPRYSEMWQPRFRIAEAYLIAAEAAFETNGLNTGSDALSLINTIRTQRGKIQALSTLTFANIVNEYRVEFAFEDHRFWDLKRWRLAHTVWDNSSNAQPQSLYPYKVSIPGDINNGKWVFDRVNTYKRPTQPFYFAITDYIGTIDASWRTNNPNWTLNPYQN